MNEFDAIRRYFKTRSPIWAVSPIAIILLGMGLNTPRDALHTSSIFWIVSGTLFLLLIRICDDISDIEIDSVVHPDRVLSTNPNLAKTLTHILIGVILIIGIVNLSHIPALIFMSVALAAFILFFRFKHAMPVILHVAILNMSLGVLPLYSAFWERGEIGPLAIGAALFVSLGGFAHDLSHSVQDPLLIAAQTREGHAIKPIETLNQRSMASMALIAYWAAALIGGGLFFAGLTNVGFMIALMFLTILCSVLCLRLIRYPKKSNAAVFYVLGFAFFLVPAFFGIVGEI